jgi:FkbM family methyltransferase
MYARGLRRMGYSGRIASFEPVPEELAKNRALNGGDALWSGYECAIGNEEGEKSFNVIEQQDGTRFFSSFLMPQGAPPVSRVITVKVRCLSAILPAIATSEDRIFLKSDTQGYDLKVLDGLGSYIEQVRCIQMEVSVQPIYKDSPSYLKALDVLQQLGFTLMSLMPVDHTDQGAVQEYDCLVVRLK